MPDTTISAEQRGALYRLVRNHLMGLGDVRVAMEERRDFATARRLGLEFGRDFRRCSRISAGPRRTTGRGSG